MAHKIKLISFVGDDKNEFDDWEDYLKVWAHSLGLEDALLGRDSDEANNRALFMHMFESLAKGKAKSLLKGPHDRNPHKLYGMLVRKYKGVDLFSLLRSVRTLLTLEHKDGTNPERFF